MLCTFFFALFQWNGRVCVRCVRALVSHLYVSVLLKKLKWLDEKWKNPKFLTILIFLFVRWTSFRLKLTDTDTHTTWLWWQTTEATRTFRIYQIFNDTGRIRRTCSIIFVPHIFNIIAELFKNNIFVFSARHVNRVMRLLLFPSRLKSTTYKLIYDLVSIIHNVSSLEKSFPARRPEDQHGIIMEMISDVIIGLCWKADWFSLYSSVGTILLPRILSHRSKSLRKKSIYGNILSFSSLYVFGIQFFSITKPITLTPQPSSP